MKWQDQGACKGVTEHSIFFPNTTEEGWQAKQAKAIAICRGCPVKEECLNHALQNDEHFGVWGGTTERGRRRIRSLRLQVQS